MPVFIDSLAYPLLFAVVENHLDNTFFEPKLIPYLIELWCGSGLET